MPAGRRLVLVRHGRTDWNAAGRFQGHADPPLDEVGRAQAAAAGPELSAAGVERPQVVSSDLRRATATAAEIAAALGVEASVDPRLREVDLGSWEGLTRPEAAARFGSEYRRWEQGDDVARGGGETLARAGVRVAGAVVDLLAGSGPEPLVVVGHGLSLKAAVGVLAAAGAVVWSGPPPHLGNGAFVSFAAARARPVPVGPSV